MDHLDPLCSNTDAGLYATSSAARLTGESA